MGNNAAYDLWWKNAVIYCLDVELFADGDGDGCGDFPGLTGKVDHLAGLGVTGIWLMPFYPTADRDDGYDITDFYGVDPRLGTLGDLVECLRAARERGIRVIADLVVNHTSDQHPWFQSARAEEASPFRDFYVWADEQPDGPRTWSSPTPRTPTGTTTRSRASGSCTASTPTCPTSTSPTRGSGTRSPRSSATGWSWACRASGSTPPRS